MRTTVLKSEDTPDSAAARFVRSPGFEQFSLWVVLINSIGIAASTYGNELNAWLGPSGSQVLGWIEWLDVACLGYFTVEIVLKLSVLRKSYFSDSWNVFDFLIVAVSLLAQHPVFSALRSLRAIRVLRLVTRFKTLRLMSKIMIESLVGCFSITMLSLVLMFIFSAIGNSLFGLTNPEEFGNLHRGLHTLFRVSSLYAYDDVVGKLVENHPYFYAFIIPYFIVMSYVFINFFSAIILYLIYEVSFEEIKTGEVNASEETEEESAEEMPLPAQAMQDILAELKALRAEVSQLKGQDA